MLQEVKESDVQKPCMYDTAFRVLFQPYDIWEDIKFIDIFHISLHAETWFAEDHKSHNNNSKQLINNGPSTPLIRPILRHFHHQMHRYILENTLQMANSN